MMWLALGVVFCGVFGMGALLLVAAASDAPLVTPAILGAFKYALYVVSIVVLWRSRQVEVYIRG